MATLGAVTLTPRTELAAIDRLATPVSPSLIRQSADLLQAPVNKLDSSQPLINPQQVTPLQVLPAAPPNAPIAAAVATAAAQTRTLTPEEIRFLLGGAVNLPEQPVAAQENPTTVATPVAQDFEKTPASQLTPSLAAVKRANAGQLVLPFRAPASPLVLNPLPQPEHTLAVSIPVPATLPSTPALSPSADSTRLLLLQSQLAIFQLASLGPQALGIPVLPYRTNFEKVGPNTADVSAVQSLPTDV